MGVAPGTGEPCAGDRDAMPGDSIDLTVTMDPETPSPLEPLAFGLVLQNEGPDAVRLDFSSGQRFDFVVRDAAGEPVWRWSDDRSFIQALGSETMPPGDSLVYQAELERGLELGRYTVVGMVPTRNRSLRDSVEVEVSGEPPPSTRPRAPGRR